MIKASNFEKEIENKTKELKKKEDLVKNLESLINDLTKEIEEKNNIEKNKESLINELKNQLEKLRLKNSELEAKEIDKEKIINNLEEKNNEYEQSISNLNVKINNMKLENNKLIQEKDMQLKQLNEEIINYKNTSEIIIEKCNKINMLEEEINQLKTTIELNQNIINEKDKKISSLESQINLNNQIKNNELSKINQKYNDLFIKFQQEQNEKEIIITENKEIKNNKITLENEINNTKIQNFQIQKKLEDIEKKYNELQMHSQNELKKFTQQTENYNLKIKENELEISNLNKKINELINTLKEKEEISKIKEFELLNIKNLNNEKDKTLNIKIETIEENYKKKFNEFINKLKKNLLKAIGENMKQIKNKYNYLYEKTEKIFDEKFIELNNIMISKLNIKKEPILELPKSENKNFNLVNKEKNFQNIIKIVQNDEEKNINNQNDINKLINSNKEVEDIIFNNNGERIRDSCLHNKFNKMNNDNGNNINVQEKNYSYCTSSKLLSIYINKGSEEVNFEINLKNNGEKTWDNDAKLLIDPSSNCKVDEVILSPQNPNEEKSYKVKVKDLKNYSVGDYKVIFSFYSGGKIHGEKIVAIIRIKEENDINNEIAENIDKIHEFRDTFNLSEDDYPNEKILEILKKYNFNYEDAFCFLFN